MKLVSKALVGTVAAGAMALSSACPAYARDNDHGIGTGEILAGAVILGGIAALTAIIGDDDDVDRRARARARARARDHDREYRRNRNDDHRSNRRRGSRAAIERCTRAVKRDARRAGYRNAYITQIRDIERKRHGWKVKGRLVVEGARGYRGYRSNVRFDREYHYERGDSGARRGQVHSYRSVRSDKGKFTCDVRRGRVVDTGYRKIRGLR